MRRKALRFSALRIPDPYGLTRSDDRWGSVRRAEKRSAFRRMTKLSVRPRAFSNRPRIAKLTRRTSVNPRQEGAKS